jgi:hypothetical protein
VQAEPVPPRASTISGPKGAAPAGLAAAANLRRAESRAASRALSEDGGASLLCSASSSSAASSESESEGLLIWAVRLPRRTARRSWKGIRETPDFRCTGAPAHRLGCTPKPRARLRGQPGLLLRRLGVCNTHNSC